MNAAKLKKEARLLNRVEKAYSKLPEGASIDSVLQVISAATKIAINSIRYKYRKIKSKKKAS